MKTNFFSCECGSLNHTFFISVDEDSCYISVHLYPKSFFERVIHAVKYIFGFRSKYGDFEEILINKEDVKDIINILNNYLNQQ